MIEKNKIMWSFLLISLITISFFANFGIAEPEGVVPSFVSNSTKNSTVPGSRADVGGYIYTVNMNVTQQDSRWKAYVGNISGKFTLDDSLGNTIYDWNIQEASITGEVFASRNDTITWANIGCANSTIIETEDSSVGFSSTSADNINFTFDSTIHEQRIVAGVTIANSSCRSIATYINDTPQSETESAKFQEILLDDDVNMVYTSIMEQDVSGYETGANENNTYDFQMIVANNESLTTGTTYYFYVELG